MKVHVTSDITVLATCGYYDHRALVFCLAACRTCIDCYRGYHEALSMLCNSQRLQTNSRVSHVHIHAALPLSASQPMTEAGEPTATVQQGQHSTPTCTHARAAGMRSQAEHAFRINTFTAPIQRTGFAVLQSIPIALHRDRSHPKARPPQPPHIADEAPVRDAKPAMSNVETIEPHFSRGAPHQITIYYE